jgi:hypothetical protein
MNNQFHVAAPNRVTVILAGDRSASHAVVICPLSATDAALIFGALPGYDLVAVIESDCVVCSEFVVPMEQLLWELSEPTFDACSAQKMSDARVRCMELGFSVWPAPSHWAPMDLPWKERRILIGIVEGIASLSKWAHEIWLRDQALRWDAEDKRLLAEWDAAHPDGPCCPVCDYCGSPRCTDGSC